MWSTIELHEVRVFLALAGELHFRRTAEQLHLTPARVSQVLRDLEHKTGVPLVYRTSRRVELTQFGERFRREVGGAYEQFMNALKQWDAAGTPPLLRLGLFSDPGVSRIAQIVKVFEQRYPGCSVQAAEVPVGDPFGPLLRGAFDLMASWLPHGQADVVCGPILSREPRVLAVCSDHPLAARDEVSIEDLAGYEVMHFDTMPKEFHNVWIPAKTPTGRPIRHRRFSEHSLGDRGRMTSELLYLITIGRVVHPTVPSFANMFAHPDIVYVPIPDMPPLCSALVWRRRGSNPLLRDFVAVARDVVRNSGRASPGA
ncbi:LysR family transcriptional regulator [Nonomuraea sp. M3C6]|uniref:LysR family transcriptional regulator n=1 Tax=Nonomuraea marmarensis TaxID=3351344 RepID=A0ABW7AN33_9ACTN